MGNRLSRIVTRTGDSGTTGLGDGTRVAKDCLRIAAIGDIDELNSSLGVLLAEDLPGAIRDALLGIQHDLFDLGGEICIPGSKAIDEMHIKRLEILITELNGELPALKEFILPGGTRAAALSHMSRAICRRAGPVLSAGGWPRDRACDCHPLYPPCPAPAQAPPAADVLRRLEE